MDVDQVSRYVYYVYAANALAYSAPLQIGCYAVLKFHWSSKIAKFNLLITCARNISHSVLQSAPSKTHKLIYEESLLKLNTPH
jgi:hypothetical protein